VRQWLAVDRRIAADVASVVEAAGRRNLPDVEAASRRKDLHDLQSTSLSAQLGVTTCTRS
jgi:hypothetical protein